ncbi:MAG: hypothetical protein WCT37_00085 [Patescibacteria group bacterium]|jgi:hypothetical protein
MIDKAFETPKLHTPREKKNPNTLTAMERYSLNFHKKELAAQEKLPKRKQNQARMAELKLKIKKLEETDTPPAELPDRIKTQEKTWDEPVLKNQSDGSNIIKKRGSLDEIHEDLLDRQPAKGEQSRSGQLKGKRDTLMAKYREPGKRDLKTIYQLQEEIADMESARNKADEPGETEPESTEKGGALRSISRWFKKLF